MIRRNWDLDHQCLIPLARLTYSIMISAVSNFHFPLICHLISSSVKAVRISVVNSLKFCR